MSTIMSNLVTAQFNRSRSIPVAETFLACLARAKHETKPFDYWLLKDAIPEEDIDAIVDLAASPPEGMALNGKRETNNALRFFFSPENQGKFPVCRRVAEGFKDARVRRAIEETTGTDLSNAHLRIEYCQDPPGFWLEPHTDIGPKKFTMSIFLCEGEGAGDLGTDIFDANKEWVARAPSNFNQAMLFIPSKTTFHGFRERSWQGLRKSLIVNYVTQEFRSRHELAYPETPVRGAA